MRTVKKQIYEDGILLTFFGAIGLTAVGLIGWGVWELSKLVSAMPHSV